VTRRTKEVLKVVIKAILRAVFLLLVKSPVLAPVKEAVQVLVAIPTGTSNGIDDDAKGLHPKHRRERAKKRRFKDLR